MVSPSLKSQVLEIGAVLELNTLSEPGSSPSANRHRGVLAAYAGGGVTKRIDVKVRTFWYIYYINILPVSEERYQRSAFWH
ncbi:unnamed protein product [Cylicostephanus goldi]|uniref:Uncharacterized protein n=1 Tax=Cylicostephanus goldi TaxID=71465 RepID=A0A3P6QFD1_CYLGO|nr:unnamed protein product [Cylicostephanus goldi]